VLYGRVDIAHASLEPVGLENCDCPRRSSQPAHNRNGGLGSMRASCPERGTRPQQPLSTRVGCRRQLPHRLSQKGAGRRQMNADTAELGLNDLALAQRQAGADAYLAFRHFRERGDCGTDDAERRDGHRPGERGDRRQAID
jgi:hypothetical protein